jgi:hypothetical protein
VASIDVHGDVGQIQRLESICDTIAVTGGRVNAGLEVDVGDQVGETVGLDDQGNGNVGVLLEDGNNGCVIISMFAYLNTQYTYGRCTLTCSGQGCQRGALRWRP